ncbi:uncharacterized protein LOC105194543 isoform X4 [Solenopsis invicta]|nr:uncharacterized protein LOC105194543 isoform X4 [Solenopsis invicta]XP_039302568.1 uncharacterized protein LOC105194543 isoform X4 [Solenopsis invicta]XP_039302569.1 uncharacterized protein LOC105194543 isoform X4 [Solenopsis invicta]XP_039302570.1 uncharacterized protein LOC105194543 isoform X4 [Solenopsis invicta]XP_039302571.1 uncharacterized protein LOC105194543 isoform X4 [Solenopsis invicta]
MQQVQATQDGNNNGEVAMEKFLVSDPDSSMKTMDMDNMEFEFRLKFRKLNEENNDLRGELERCEESINTLRQKLKQTEQQLKHYKQKCQQFEKENNEQRDQLNELIEKEKTIVLELIEKERAMTLDLQRCTEEKEKLLKQLEIAEIEILTIPFLKEKLEKITKEKESFIDVIAKMQEEFEEKEDSCRYLRTTITELEDTSISLKENYECMISSLREKNRLLETENEELQSLSSFNVYPSGEKFSPMSDTNEYNMHSTPYKSTPTQNSLYMELKVSGFTAECSRSDREDLEEELNQYDATILEIMEQLEKVIEFFVTMRGSADNSSYFNPQDTDVRTRTVDVLKHKVSFLLNMTAEEVERRNTRQDSSTQFPIDSANATDDLAQFDNESLQAYRSIHTLPSGLQSSSLVAEDSISQKFSYQNSGTNTADVLPFAQGDGLTQKKEQFTPPAEEVFNQKDLTYIEENCSSEMSKGSNVLQVDTKALATSEEEKTDARSFQVPEVSSASNPTSPRRKISVYCRSFDVVAVQDRREDHPRSNNLEVRESPSKPDDSPARIDRIAARDRNNTPNQKYLFNDVYRNVKSDSDSSNSTPVKHFQDVNDESPIAPQPIFRKVQLAPTRLRFSEARSELDKATVAPSCASPVPVDSTELNISITRSNSSSSLSPVDRRRKDDDGSVYLSSTFVNEDKMEVKSTMLESKSSNENISQTFSVPNRCLFPRYQADSAKIADSEDPHSEASVQRVCDNESQSRIERSVDSQMSSRKDSLAVSGSECEPAVAEAGCFDQCSTINEKVASEAGKAVNVVSSTSLTDEPISAKVVSYTNLAQSDEKARERDRLMKQKIRKSRFLNMKRSYSEDESLGQLECHCKRRSRSLIPEDSQSRVFPSLTDTCLQEFGIANLSDDELECNREDPSELELQKKYTAFSLCLCVDRLTLPRRIAMSIRQRDQSEKNLSSEVENMQQDIQELAPLCMDRESAERVDRVRHRLDMIVRCAHRVSCTAETLGAVHQERRISRAILLADKYLQLLQSRCEKLITSVAEIKRILVENNIVIEENSGELNDEVPRIRYRSGTPVNNRMMMARRRASVATMSRPMGSTQDVTKDIVRQRNSSVSGRMTLRRPSFHSESPKWEIEKLDRAESSNSINELRGIFEHAESRRNSKEENNNMRLSHSNSQSTVNCALIDKVWTNVKEEEEEEEPASEVFDNENIHSESRSSTKSSFQLRRRRRPILPIILSILIFFLLFYVIRVMMAEVVYFHVCQDQPLNKLVEYVIERYRQMKKTAPHPM